MHLGSQPSIQSSEQVHNILQDNGSAVLKTEIDAADGNVKMNDANHGGSKSTLEQLLDNMRKDVKNAMAEGYGAEIVKNLVDALQKQVFLVHV